jgi:hypothetical protein
MYERSAIVRIALTGTGIYWNYVGWNFKKVPV